MMRKWGILACLLLCGCNLDGPVTETVYLAKPGAANVQCGPYGKKIEMAGGDSSAIQANYQRQLRDCVNDYQKAGYQRVPGP